MKEKTKNINLKRRLALERFPLDGQAVKNLIAAGMAWLKTNQEIVNSLNVFPVPDGDTGTNMVLTMQSAFSEIENSPETHTGKMFGAVAQGALMGARGNSGVILSQLWRGIATAMEEEEKLTGKGLSRGFVSASETAYKGVVRPVEGTILTVSKDIGIATEKAAKNTDNPFEILEVALEAAAISVEHTPELLQVLKDAGVVDSGGKGLFYLLEGMVRWMDGQDLYVPAANVKTLSALELEHAMDDVEEGQDYEIVVDFKPTNPLVLETFYSGLEELGTSIQVGEGDGMYRMHIHVPVENRYLPIDYCMDLGTVTNVAIENLIAQMEEIEAQTAKKIDLTPLIPGEIAVVAVAPGPGISKVFASMGVTALVEGGQTMNPSTQDIMAAFENLPTEHVVILPNNNNIVMAAEAASELTVKKVKVIKSRTVPQGLAAMMRLVPHGDYEKVCSEMESAIDDVETEEITTATRTVEIDGVEVESGEIIALLNGKLVLSASSLVDGCLDLMEKIDMDDYEIMTLFYGNNISKDQVDEVVSKLEEKYPDHEVEIQEGGQPHYQFIFSIE